MDSDPQYPGLKNINERRVRSIGEINTKSQLPERASIALEDGDRKRGVKF